MFRYENETKMHMAIYYKTIITICIYCLSGTLLTLVNKLAITIIPHPLVLLLLQNSASVICLFFGLSFCCKVQGPKVSMNIFFLKLWTTLAIIFVLILTSSLFALLYVSIPTVIVMRNLSTLATALLEYLILGNKQSVLCIVTLLGIFAGSIFYGKNDLTFNLYGYIWLFTNITATSIYQIYVKKIINLPSMKHVSIIEMSYHNNLISLPLLSIFAYIIGEFKSLNLQLEAFKSLKTESLLIIMSSCVLGLSLSVSAFTLNKLVSATSMMVVNNVNKFCLIALSEIFVEQTLHTNATLSALYVLFLGCLYSQASKNVAKYIFTIFTLVFMAVYFILEHRQTIATNTVSRLNYTIPTTILAGA